MFIRLLLFFVFIFLALFFKDSSNLYAACSHGEDSDFYYFSDCGTPTSPEIEGLENQVTTWNKSTKTKMKIQQNSYVKFLRHNFSIDQTIELQDPSAALDLQLEDNTTDISINMYNGGTFIYRKAINSTGSVSFDIGIDSSCQNAACKFYSIGDIKDLTSVFSWANNYLFFTVGIKEPNGSETSGSVTIDNLDGGGLNIEVLKDSLLNIKKFTYYDKKIYRITGLGDIIFEDSEITGGGKVGIDEISILGATFNGGVNITNIDAGVGSKYIFNSSSLSIIDKITNLDTIFLNNQSEVRVQILDTLNEVNLGNNSKITFTDSDTTGASLNTINKIQGEGILNIATDNMNNPFTVKDINIDELSMSNSLLIIKNDIPYYTNEGSNEKISHRIKNITASGGFSGNLVVQGNVIIDHITELNKLTLCDTSLGNCNNVNLTLNNVLELGEFEMNGGRLHLELSPANLNTPKLEINKVNFNGGEVFSLITDTTIINIEGITFNVIRGLDSLNVNMPYDNFKVFDLPKWYEYEYRLSDDDKTLLLDIKRNPNPYTYRTIVLKSSYKDNEDILNFATYIDEVLYSEVPLDISAKTITYIDLLSDSNYDNVATSIESLFPLSRDKYLKTAHFNLKEALNSSKKKEYSQDLPFMGVRYKKGGLRGVDKKISTNKGSTWFSVSVSNGKYNTNKIDVKDKSNQDSYNSSMYQFGYNFAENGDLSYGIIGGFSQGNMNNFNYDSKIFSFNIGSNLDYRYKETNIRLSSLYGLSTFDVQRDYFISLYAGEDFPDLDKSILKSTLRTHEILFDAELSYNLIDENNMMITSRVYITPSIFFGESYKEKGSYSFIEGELYLSSILESGLGIDSSYTFKEQTNSNITLFLITDAFYRYYSLPDVKIHFNEVSDGVKMDKSEWAGLVLVPQIGVNFEYKKSNFYVHYKREIAENYYQNILGINYEYFF